MELTRTPIPCFMHTRRMIGQFAKLPVVSENCRNQARLFMMMRGMPSPN